MALVRTPVVETLAAGEEPVSPMVVMDGRRNATEGGPVLIPCKNWKAREREMGTCHTIRGTYSCVYNDYKSTRQGNKQPRLHADLQDHNEGKICYEDLFGFYTTILILSLTPATPSCRGSWTRGSASKGGGRGGWALEVRSCFFAQPDICRLFSSA